MFVCVFFVFMLFIAPYQPGDPGIFEALKQLRTVGATAFLTGLATYFFNRLHAYRIERDQWLTQCVMEIVKSTHDKSKIGEADAFITAARHTTATTERKRILKIALDIAKYAHTDITLTDTSKLITNLEMIEIRDEIFTTVYKPNKAIACWLKHNQSNQILKELFIV